MKGIVGLLVLVTCTVGVAAAEPAGPTEVVASIQSRLVRSPILRATFEQQRHMEVLARPLVTRGRLTVVADRGLLWQAIEPHEITILVTRNKITEWDDTSGPRHLDISAGSQYRVLADLLLGRPATNNSAGKYRSSFANLL